MEFKEQVCLVTGAAQGIGLSVSELLLKNHAIVAMLDINSDRLSDVTCRLRKQYPGQVTSQVVDLCDQAAVKQCTDETEKELGQIRQLVHCAGVLHLGKLIESSYSDFSLPIDVNVKGSFNIIQSVAIKMMERQSGNIVAIGSNAANTPRNKMGSYCASKAALHMLIRCFGLELCNHGIRCNLVSPGSTRTKMQTRMWNSSYTETDTINGDLSQHRLGIPLGKLAKPEDIAEAVLFLLSERSSHITMHDLRVDGGATLGNL